MFLPIINCVTCRRRLPLIMIPVPINIRNFIMHKHDKRTFANIYNRTVLFTFRVYLNNSKIGCGIDGLAVLKFPF